MVQYLRSSSVWGAPLVFCVSVGTIFLYPHATYALSAIGFVAVFFTLLLLKNTALVSEEFFGIAISPIAFVTTATGFLLFLDNHTVRITLLVVAAFFLFLYLHQLYLLHFNPSKYQTFSLESISAYINLISVFCASVVAYGLLVFLSLPLWLVSIVLLVVVGAITFQGFWIQKIAHQSRLIYTAALNVMIVQLFWALSFLPIHFYVHGALLAVTYYVLWGLMRAMATDTLSRTLMLRYLGIGMLLSAALVGTAPWM